jgi:hypothetical protein
MRGFAVLSILLAALLGTLALAGCGGDDADGEGAAEVSVELDEASDSGQTGTAVLTAEGDQTRVVVTIDGDPVSPSQPAHIHEGTCEELNPEPAYGLPNVAGGTSDTTVDVALTTLTESAFAINLHFSDDELGTYTSCGNIE